MAAINDIKANANTVMREWRRRNRKLSLDIISLNKHCLTFIGQSYIIILKNKNKTGNILLIANEIVSLQHAK
jgi:hypothetical protein